jgi:hypothetical protein
MFMICIASVLDDELHVKLTGREGTDLVAGHHPRVTDDV